MLVASSVCAELDASAVPLITGAYALADAGFVPGGTKRNLETIDPFVEWDDSSDLTRTLLADAQTSGGLLAACPAPAVDGLLRDLETELACAVVGRVGSGEPGTVNVRGDVA
jgi:selenide,water dikinase